MPSAEHQLPAELIRAQLTRILDGTAFTRSPQAVRFLRFVVEETLAGRGNELKAYSIGLAALNAREERSDPDSMARMQASRVRRLLAAHYAGLGRTDRVLIELPVGSYEPRFSLHGEPQQRSRAPSVLVEPYVARSPSPDTHWLADGITEDVLASLVRFEGLRVLSARDSTERSDFVLSGSVWLLGDRVRIFSVLTQCDSRERVWYARHDTAFGPDRLFEIQDEVSNAVACRVGDPSVGAVARALRQRPETREADEALQRFHQYLTTYSRSSFDAAVSSLEGAVQLEPDFALSRAAYADLLATAYALDPGASKERLALAEEHARAAVALAPESQHARFAKGFVHFHRRETASAHHELRAAIELNPRAPHLVVKSGLLLALMGDWEEGLPLVERAFGACPELPGCYHLGHSAYHLIEEGNAAAALRWAELFDMPTIAWDPLLRAAALALLGKRQGARKAVADLLTLVPDFESTARARLAGYLYREDAVETFLAALQQAGLRVGRPRASALPRKNPGLAARSDEVRIGVLHAMTGPMALSEAPLVDSFLLAVDELNDRGGVLGRRVCPMIEDGQSDPAVFAARAEQLLERDEVCSIFGCWTSSSRKAVRPVVEAHQSILWYPLQYEGLESSPHIVYTGSCLNQQIEPAVRWLVEQGRRRCFLVGSDYVFPRTANQLIRARVESQGGVVLGEAYRELGADDFGDVAEAIRDLRPDVIFSTVNGSDNVGLFRDLADAGVRPEQSPVMSFSLSEVELREIGAAAVGHLASWSYFQSLPGEANQSLLARHRRRFGFGSVLSDPVVTAHAQVDLWASTVEHAGSFEPLAVLAAVGGRRFALGADVLEVRGNRHVARPSRIGRARADGDFEVIWESAGLVEPWPWLGVEETKLDTAALIVRALGSLPNELNSQAPLSRRSTLPPAP